MNEILNTTIFNNTVSNYLIVIAVIVGSWVIRKFVVRLIADILFRFLQQRFPNATAETFFNLLYVPLRWLFLLIVAGIAIRLLHYPLILDIKIWQIPLHNLVIIAYKVIVTFVVGFCLSRIIDFVTFALSKSIHDTSSKADDQALMYAKELVKFAIFVSAILFILARIFGIDVSTALAGAGIVGLAVALAVKETLQNLFSSFVIFLEQPFVVGDYVKMDTVKGIVEHIGFRSTWIRTPENVLINIPNHKMVDSITENIPQTALRKVSLSLRLPHTTTSEQIMKLTTDIHTFIETFDQTEQKVEVGLDSFAENALLVTINYFLLDRTDALRTKELINFAILDLMRQHDVTFAPPPNLKN